MFASLLAFNFLFSVLCIKAPSDVDDNRLPLAVAVDSRESQSPTALVRSGSLTSSYAGSQPTASQGEDISTPRMGEEKHIPSYGSHTEFLDEMVVKTLYASVRYESVEPSDFRKALLEMATRICSAKLAIAILCKAGKWSPDMTETDVSRILEEAFPTFLLYQMTNPTIFSYWKSELEKQGLRCG